MQKLATVLPDAAALYTSPPSALPRQLQGTTQDAQWLFHNLAARPSATATWLWNFCEQRAAEWDNTAARCKGAADPGAAHFRRLASAYRQLRTPSALLEHLVGNYESLAETHAAVIHREGTGAVPCTQAAAPLPALPWAMDMCEGTISDGVAFAERYLDWCASLTQHEHDSIVSATVVGHDGVTLGDVDTVAACALATCAAGNRKTRTDAPPFVRAILRGRGSRAASLAILRGACFQSTGACDLVGERPVYSVTPTHCEPVDDLNETGPAWCRAFSAADLPAAPRALLLLRASSDGDYSAWIGVTDLAPTGDRAEEALYIVPFAPGPACLPRAPSNWEFYMRPVLRWRMMLVYKSARSGLGGCASLYTVVTNNQDERREPLVRAAHAALSTDPSPDNVARPPEVLQAAAQRSAKRPREEAADGGHRRRHRGVHVAVGALVQACQHVHRAHRGVVTQCAGAVDRVAAHRAAVANF